jgi:Gluconate 2-dehydrogenase subunit 3
MDSENGKLNRRDWVLSIAEAAIAIGVADRAAVASTPVGLPPGLYEPSTDDLGHALMSAQPFRMIPPGCPTDYIRPSGAPFRPLFFSTQDFAVIRRITELLLGDREIAQEVASWIDLRVASAAAVREAALHLDPLHRTLAVAYYGRAQVSESESADPPAICQAGLDWLKSAARRDYGDGFLTLDEGRQLALLGLISDEHTRDADANPGARMFTFLKREAIHGFYTSQAGLKELDFKGNAFYARSPGCRD